MYTVDEIIGKMTKLNEANEHLVRSAYAFAATAHAEQKRYSGEPYMTHLAAVAYKIAEMGMGPRSVSAALLHDTIEDTAVTADDIKEKFGEEILYLVEGVTKLSSVRYYGKDRHNESLRKLFVATSQDIRVLIIKLCDRLHNMETLGHVPKEKQERIARETLEIYVPVAHRLGMGKLRKELEDIAFFYVLPDEFERVKQIRDRRAGKSGEILERERKSLQKRLAESKLLDFNTSYRVKGLYSLYHKLMRKDWEIDSVYDLLAIRVIVPSVEDCYRTLGIIHEIWRPLPGRMKDYIAFPKPNGYQSIHTTVTSNHGTIMEIQIRTRQMHQEAEFGVASHLVYKEQTLPQQNSTTTGGRFANLIPSLFRPFSKQAIVEPVVNAKIPNHKERIPQWISQIGEMYTKEETGSQFMADMRQDFFMNRIFVFTPNGDVVDLPVGATPIDFAYAIHSEIGNHIAGAKVNKKLVQLETELKNGDIVEIDTKDSAKPSKKWLDIAKTSLARRHIRGELGLPNPK
jgi:guanosine-3',5'-bis(diphosphate) 3'-pyrophosphohydrolase